MTISPINTDIQSISIGFLGGGNMAQAMLEPLIAALRSPKQIMVSDLDQDKLKYLESTFGIQTTSDNQNLVNQCDWIVLAVKPQQLETLLKPLTISAKAKIISIAAGVSCQSLNNWLQTSEPQDITLIRAMPNTPAAIGKGITGIWTNTNNHEFKTQADIILSSIGQRLWVKQESDLDIITALSGSGPAYFFYLMEAMAEAGIALGLSIEEVIPLVIETAIGAAHLAQAQIQGQTTDRENFASLRQAVTSPNGTTAAAIETLNQHQAQTAIQQAVKSAWQRSITLSEELK